MRLILNLWKGVKKYFSKMNKQHSHSHFPDYILLLGKHIEIIDIYTSFQK